MEQAAQLAQLEEEVVRNVEEAVKLKVEDMMQSEEIQLRIQVGIQELYDIMQRSTYALCLRSPCVSIPPRRYSFSKFKLDYPVSFVVLSAIFYSSTSSSNHV